MKYRRKKGKEKEKDGRNEKEKEGKWRKRKEGNKVIGRGKEKRNEEKGEVINEN